MPHAAQRASRTFEHGGAPIDGELGFTVEDYEKLLAGVMEVSANAALWF
jgi:hypothetical protein